MPVEFNETIYNFLQTIPEKNYPKKSRKPSMQKRKKSET